MLICTFLPYLSMVQNVWMKSRWKSGQCELRGHMNDHLEFHHESYDTERGLHVCHEHHNLIHWRTMFLTDADKRNLLSVRLGDLRLVTQEMVDNYVPPSRP